MVSTLSIWVNHLVMLRQHKCQVWDKAYKAPRVFSDSEVKNLVVEEGPEKEPENTTNSQGKHQSFMGIQGLIDLLNCYILFKC